MTRGWALAASCAFTSLLVLASPTLATTASPSDVAAESPCPNSTLGGFTPALPDCRAYELVSNPFDETYVPPGDEEGTGGAGGNGEYQGGSDFAGQEYAFQAAPDGEKLTYVGGESNSGEGGNGFTSDSFGNQYLSARGSSGWQASDISLATNSLVSLSAIGEFSPDLSLQIAEGLLSTSKERVSAEPEAPAECIENELASTYSRDAGGLHALVTAHKPGSFECFAAPAGISADNRHILLESAGAYVAGAVESPQFHERNIYDSVGGLLHQVNILPDGEPEQSPEAAVGVKLSLGENRWGNLDGAVSADGSRVFWSTLAGFYVGPRALYARENDVQPQSPVVGGQCTVPGDACTVQLDASQGGTGASGGGFYWAASHDGSKVFFTDCSRLTADSTANAETACFHPPNNIQGSKETARFTGSDLYEYDFERPVGQRLVDLAVDHNSGDALGADVQGVVGVSEDGGSVYFVANGVLAGANAEGHAPAGGQLNLYLLHEGVTTFIATLAASDNTFADGPGLQSEHPIGDWEAPLGWRTARVAPGGAAVAFESTQQLTGYDSVGLPEVFAYQTGSRRLTCVSCDPSGAPPDPSLGLGHRGTRLLGSFLGLSGQQFFQPRSIVEREGVQVYFMTSQALVPSDRNGLQDVYEWESDGSGGCRDAGGCITLISDAGSLSNSYFIESGANGRDVFFTTRSQLTADGVSETLKLYDARVDGGRAEVSQACTGTGCQGVPPAPPIFSTPSTATFNGDGNYPPSPPPPTSIKPKPKKKPVKCKRRSRKKHARCVKPKRKAHRARTSVNTGRGGGN
jgi:hypothetical protein